MSNPHASILVIAVIALTSPLLSVSLSAQEKPSVDLVYEEVLVTGGADGVRRMPGSATFLDGDQIADFDSVDVNHLLRQVPGVYLRVEDGYGLRPNIGLRGATSERSQKITLMEDGVLIAPSPYSAPAAYYFPNVIRMDSLEVFKGPSSVRHGPHTVGGALNLVTAPIPESTECRVEASLGSDNFQKYRVFYGDSFANDYGQWGYWIDALRFSADGFKELDGGGDTGFARNDVNVKLQWSSDTLAAITQQVQLKLGYSDEGSDETYLGLSDADFNIQPERRYTASQLDQFESEHLQVHLTHIAKLDSGLQFTSKMYVNEFERDWFKFDGFFGSAAAPAVVLANPEVFPREISLLRGETDSNGAERETLDVTDFARNYGSAGVDIRVAFNFGAGSTANQLEGGIRYHHDYVERDHTPEGYLVRGETLVYDSLERADSLNNEWETDAIAVFLNNTMDWKNLTLDFGLRYEFIDGRADDLLAGTSQTRDQNVFIPGFGAFYQLSESWGLLAGINKGFSPASPGAGREVDPEESVNYEYGVRYTSDSFTADLIGFFSDYENLLGRCRISDPGCNVGEEFNGGEVEIAGVEFSANYNAQLTKTISVPMGVVYTYTESAFQTSFRSNFSQWNPGYFQGQSLSVRQGDELPYLPEHQARAQIGLASEKWNANLAVRYMSEMREVPGRDSFETGESTEDHFIADLSVDYYLTPDLKVKLVVENLANEEVVVSRRPFGARPNQGRNFKIGVVFSF